MKLQLKDTSLKCHLHTSETTENKFYKTIFHSYEEAGGTKENGTSVTSNISI